MKINKKSVWFRLLVIYAVVYLTISFTKFDLGWGREIYNIGSMEEHDRSGLLFGFVMITIVGYFGWMIIDVIIDNN